MKFLSLVEICNLKIQFVIIKSKKKIKIGVKFVQ